ncbi:MAG: biotin--[acetyl-CoA-carboxylase] ligase [Thermoplasmatales archaeon]|nr:MAG: biotin--[acetyl-CoA-carboxylase] ligase [Thermoplasmatales archaeon]
MKDTTFKEKTINFSKNLDVDFVKKIIVFNEISSTNSKAKELARKGEEEGTIVIAQIQKKGRGRFDRLWESPGGGIYLSIILRPDCPPNKATLLTLVISLVVSKTINSYNLSSNIKWPNDVRVNGKKIAGILLELEANEYKVDYIILGVGINLNTNTNLLSKKIRLISTSLSEEIGNSVDYYNFLKILLFNFDKYYKLFLEKKYDSIIKEWKNQSDTLGRRVRITTSSEQIIGNACDIDQSGFLIVINDSGECKKVANGDSIYFES